MTENSCEKKKKIDFAVGGQALVEGVMMRSPNFISISIRKKNGEIKSKKDPFQSITQKYRILKTPILRGMINMVEMMSVGMKALNFSTTEYFEEQSEANEVSKAQLDESSIKAEESKEKLKAETSNKVDIKQEDEPKTTSSSFLKKIGQTVLMIFNFIIALGFALFIFKFIPLLLTDILSKYFLYLKENYLLYNLIDGLIKGSLFLIYIFIISLIPYFKRVFEYHGAEHKSIFTYEKNLPLTVENAKNQSRFHPRCGTSFLFIVILISIIIYTFIPPNPNFGIKLAERIAILPLIAGIAYESLKLSAKFQKNIFVKILTAPGLWFQKITTKEPDEKQLEIGLSALKNALFLEKEKNE